jgi:hypothetical protein
VEGHVRGRPSILHSAFETRRARALQHRHETLALSRFCLTLGTVPYQIDTLPKTLVSDERAPCMKLVS